MKKKIILFLSLCLLSAAVYALAAGDASDPLASLSYLNGTFTSKVNTQVDEKLDASDAALLSGSGADPAGSGSVATDWAECRLKSGDTLVGQCFTLGRQRVRYLWLRCGSGCHHRFRCYQRLSPDCQPPLPDSRGHHRHFYSDF